MSNSNNARQGIRNIPEICLRHGLRKAVICPGSRNAPLILSFTKHHSIDCISITDERSAGYFAMGMSQLNGDPVAVVCTSGTAVLNIAPAVSEAYYQNLPLIVFTADRPKEWIDQADGQTIRQTDIYRNYVKQSYEVPLETLHHDDLWHFNRIISQALDTATKYPAGPVHINIPLREPLYTPLPEDFKIANITKTLPVQKELSGEDLNSFRAKWNSLGKKMIICGILRQNEELKKVLQEFALRKDTVVIAENLSNIAGKDILSAPESLVASLSDEEKNNFRPDLLLTIGEGIVSKRLKQYLRAFPPAEQWHFGTSGNYTDTYKSLSVLLEVNPTQFLSHLKNNPEKGDYSELKKKNWIQNELLTKYLQKVELNDIRVIREVLKEVPGQSIVHLSNSTAIRLAQLSPSREDLTYFCNRGTSGIDGCTSTAAGSAYLSGKPVYLITGDLAFIYDSNALWNNIPELNLKIIVINNNGGNIFSLIESSPEMDKARNYFETPHKVKIKPLAEAYGAGYYECSTVEKLKEAMSNLTCHKGNCILEIRTDAKMNTKVYKEYYQYIKQA